MNLQEEDIKLFKLTTGEEFIARVVSVYDDYITLKGAISIQIVPNQQTGMVQTMMMPFPMFTTGQFDIKKEHLMFVINIEENTLNSYNSSKFGSGIITAKNLPEDNDPGKFRKFELN